MMMLLRTKEVRWRLFWALEIVGFSIWLALVGVLYLGDPEAVSPMINTSSNSSTDVTLHSLNEVIQPYFTFAFCPGTMTFCALVINSAVWNLWAAAALKRSALVATSKESKRVVCSLFLYCDVVRDIVREDPFFAGTWATLVVASFIMSATFGHSVILELSISRTDVIISGSVIAACFAAALVKLGVRRYVHRSAVGSVTSARPRLLTLCVGWGFGAAIGMAVVYCTSFQWPGQYSLVGGVIVFSLGIIVLVDFESTGSNVYAGVKPALSVLQNADGFVYWGIIGGVVVCMGAWVTFIYLGVVWKIVK